MTEIRKFFLLSVILLTFVNLSTTAFCLEKEISSSRSSWLEKEIRRFKSYPHLDMAYRLIRKHRYREAIGELEKYLEINPGDVNARLLLMYQYYAVKKFASAAGQAGIILQKDPYNTRALICRAFCYSKLGKVQRALSDFKKVINTAGDTNSRIIAYKHSAYLLARQKKYDRLLEFLESIPQKEKGKELLLLQAEALGKTRGKKAALPLLFKLARDYPEDPILLKRLAILAGLLNENKIATRWIRKSIELRPSAESKLLLANFLVQEGKRKEALEVLNTVSEPGDPGLAFEIAKQKANLAFQLGQLENAEKYYRQALRVKPDITIYRKLAHTLVMENKHRQAEAVMLKATTLSRKARDWFTLGTIQASINKHRAAVESFKKAIELGLNPPEKAAAYVSTGYEWIKLGKLTVAEKAFKDALRINPNSYSANKALGELYLKMNRPKLAERYLKEAGKLRRDTTTRQALAVALEKQGKYLDAIRALMETEKGSGERCPRVLEQIATLYFRAGNHEMAARYFLKAFEAGGRSNYELLYKAATSYQLANNLSSAINMINEYIRSPGLTSRELGLAHRQLAITYLKKGELRKAIIHFKKALELNIPRKTATSIHLQLAFVYLRLNAPSRAASEFSKVLAQQSLDRETRLKALLGMANCQIKIGNFSKADYYLEKAISLAKNEKSRALIFRQLAAMKLKEKKYHEATRYLNLLLSEKKGNWTDRLNLGYALNGLGKHREAIDEYFRAYEQERSPEILMAIANSYYLMDKPGVALHYLRKAKPLSDRLPTDKRLLMLEQLGYLALQEGSLTEAEQSLRNALSIGDSANARLFLGVVEARKGFPDKAIAMLTRGTWTNLSKEKQILRKKTLAKCYMKIGQLEKSRSLWKEITKVSPEPEAWFQLGKVENQIGNHQQALLDYQKAVELERNSTYLSAYGQELRKTYRLAEAIEIFNESLMKDPDQMRLYPDLAYLYMQTYQNEKAVKQFKLAIDYLPLTCFDSDSCKSKIETQKDKYKREITALTKKFSLTAWDAFVTGDTGTIEKGTPGGGDRIVARGTMGLEASWVIPKIGFRDYRVLEAVARTTVNLEEDSLDPDMDSWQGAAGLRYKPFKRYRFKIGMERLFSMGEDSEDNWLVRGLFDWSDGYEPDPVKTNWNYSYLYSEIDYYFPHRDRMLWYSEFRQGWSFKVFPKLVLTPHLIADGIWYTPDRDDSSFIEGGIGISGKYFWGGTNYLTDHHSIELLTYYKRGELTAGGVEDRTINGFFATLIISY